MRMSNSLTNSSSIVYSSKSQKISPVRLQQNHLPEFYDNHIWDDPHNHNIHKTEYVFLENVHLVLEEYAPIVKKMLDFSTLRSNSYDTLIKFVTKYFIEYIANKLQN